MKQYSAVVKYGTVQRKVTAVKLQTPIDFKGYMRIVNNLNYT